METPVFSFYDSLERNRGHNRMFSPPSPPPISGGHVEVAPPAAGGEQEAGGAD